LISGAIVASIVERAKEMAIKRSIDSKKDEGISEADLLRSLELEYAENDIFPPTDITEDWLMLLDYDPENVVKVSRFGPFPERGQRSQRGCLKPRARMRRAAVAVRQPCNEPWALKPNTESLSMDRTASMSWQNRLPSCAAIRRPTRPARTRR